LQPLTNHSQGYEKKHHRRHVIFVVIDAGLCNGRVSGRQPSVRLSVCPVYLPLQQRAAGLLLGAPRAGDINRQRHGGQQQMRAVSRLQKLQPP